MSSTADELFGSDGVTATYTSSEYQLAGPGTVAIRAYGVGGSSTATVVVEEKLRSDEETWGLIATLGTSFATTAGTWLGPVSGTIRVRVSAYTSGTLKCSLAAWDANGVRVIPRS